MMECWEYWSHATYSIKITVFNSPYFAVFFSTAELYIGKFLSSKWNRLNFMLLHSKFSNLFIPFIILFLINDPIRYCVIFVSLKWHVCCGIYLNCNFWFAPTGFLFTTNNSWISQLKLVIYTNWISYCFKQ